MKLSLNFNHIGNLLRDFFLITGIIVFLLFAGHFAIGGARYIKHSIQGIKTGEDLASSLKQSPVFANYQGYDDYFNDANLASTMKIVPYYHWRRTAYDGNVIKIDENSIRRTIKSPHENAKKVFLFGGSTMWGTGTPDQYTIASQLQARLGPHYDVYNFGETAFVSVQELNLLLEQLSKGLKPDIVVFYDGVNDGYAGMYSPGIPRHPQFRQEDYESNESTAKLIRKLLDKTNYIALTARMDKWLGKDDLSKWENNIQPKIENNAKIVVNNYEQLMHQVQGLASVYGFKAYHFWQPLLLTQNRKLTDYEQALFDANSPQLVASYKVLYQQAKTQLAGKPGFYYIADAFDNVNQPIFFDFCHVGPKGNEIVAAKMAQVISQKG
ncbi:MAG: hypothetical protein JSR17_06080 [Proteobacteria bacterium]|nr:hypothetical protein [Pseudomonadota bacterium]